MFFPEVDFHINDSLSLFHKKKKKKKSFLTVHFSKARLEVGSGPEDTYHVHDLYQTEGKDDGERVGVVAHRPLHPVVVFQEVLEQVPLVRTLQRH